MTYDTSDYPTVVTLYLRKHELANVDRTNPRRIIFSFTETDKLLQDLQLLNTGQLKVDPIEFWQAERRCKQILYAEAV